MREGGLFGEPGRTKRCTRCRTRKPWTEFQMRTVGRPYSQCRPCATLTGQEWRASNHELNTENSRRNWLRRKHDISLDEYDAMLAEQDSLCAICRTRCTTGIPLAVDHDHESGVRRGLLCNRCNRGLGMFRDQPELLSAAADYLLRYSQTACTDWKGQ